MFKLKRIKNREKDIKKVKKIRKKFTSGFACVVTEKQRVHIEPRSVLTDPSKPAVEVW